MYIIFVIKVYMEIWDIFLNEVFYLKFINVILNICYVVMYDKE